MALTITINKRDKTIAQKVVQAKIDFDSSYPTGGEAFLPASVGLSKINFILFEGGTGYIAEYDEANNKILTYTTAATQTANGVDLSAISFNALVFGE